MRQFLIYLLAFSALVHVNSQTIQIDIDWGNSIRQIPNFTYGVNSPANFIPSYSEDAVFMKNLELITQKKGLVRLHGWGMLDTTSPENWQNNGVWNASKINQALSPLVNQGYKVMINIPSGPSGEDDYQDPEKFAKFCADLVKIVNIDLKLGVEYWEIPNEREQVFIDPGLTVNQMATLIQTASQAMKVIDPTIKVGGATTAWVNIDYLTQLTQAIYPNIDFITCHTYAGDCTNSLQDIYDNAQFAVTDLNTLRQNINEITGTNYLPIFLTEYNLSFQGCENIRSNEGAVYDALIMTESIKSGIDGTCYWAIAPYSDMSIVIDDQLDENAYLFESFNKYFHGNLIQSTSDSNSKVLVFSTANQNANIFSFCLINRTSISQNVQVQMTSSFSSNIDKHVWNGENEYFTETTNWANLNNGNLSLSPYSVNIFTGKINTLGLFDVDNRDEIVLFPNPTKGILHLSDNNTFKTFQVFSQSGSLIKSGKFENNSIDLTNISSGIYFIKLFNEKGFPSISKVIKK